MGGIVGNRAIESAAIQWIIKLEGAAGRAALDTRALLLWPTQQVAPAHRAYYCSCITRQEQTQFV